MKERIKNKTESRKIESNPSNDRTKHKGDKPSFLDEFIKFYFFLDSSVHIRIFKQNERGGA